MSDGDERVRAALKQMHVNFAGLSDQFKVVGASMSKMAEAANKAAGAVVKPLNRMAGMMAARQDWGSKLWPPGADDEEEEDDGGRV